MKNFHLHALLLVAAVLTGVCTPASTSAISPTPTPAASPSSAGTGTPATHRSLPFVGSTAAVSPDGRYIANITPGESIDIHRIDGTRVASGRMFSGRSQWLADSSGILIETSAPQRAGPLAVIELDGRLTNTELQMAQPSLSRDGRWIVATRHEGCCVAVSIRELWIAPRTGSPARMLARSVAPADALQPIQLLGVDASDRALYRDGTALLSVTLAGGAPSAVSIPAGLNVGRLVLEGASPDGRAMVLRTSEPVTHWIFADGAVHPWPADAGAPVMVGGVGKGQAGAAAWHGPHTVLVRQPSGALGALDLTDRSAKALSAVLPIGAVALALANGSLLWSDGDRLQVTHVETGRERDTGLSPGVDPQEISAGGAAGGGFILITSRGSYFVE